MSVKGILEDPSQVGQMFTHFEDRTQKHINCDRKFIKLAGKLFGLDNTLVAYLMENHDSTKYEPAEYIPYVFMTWKYKQIREGNPDFKWPEVIEKLIHSATWHHVRHNKHHPEYWDETLTQNPINFENRDKPSGIIVDGQRMPDHYILEMLCDWCAVSVEKHTDPRDWARDNIGKRWSFTEDQVAFLRASLERLWAAHLRHPISFE